MIKQKFLSDIADLPEAYWLSGDVLTKSVQISWRKPILLSNIMSGSCELLIFVVDNFHIKIIFQCHKIVYDPYVKIETKFIDKSMCTGIA